MVPAMRHPTCLALVHADTEPANRMDLPTGTSSADREDASLSLPIPGVVAWAVIGYVTVLLSARL